MYYQPHHQRGARIPGLVALMGVLLVIIALSTLLSHKATKIAPQQGKAAKLERTEIANIRDNTITIYWETAEPSEGYLVYGPSQSEVTQKVIDKRDTATIVTPKRNHIVTIDDLNASTEYFYKIFVNGKSLGQTPDIPFQFKTTRSVKNPLNIDPIVGKVVDENGTVSSDTVVLLYIGSAYPLVAQTKADGSFIFSPCCIFNSATYEPIFPQQNEPVIVEVIDEQGKSKKFISNLGNIDSITSTIVFNNSQNDQRAAPGLADDQSVLQMAEDINDLKPIDIVFPKENAVIPGTKPLIKGVGIPGKPVKVTMEPGGRVFEATISLNKVWQFQPTFDLHAGQYNLAVTTQDEDGKSVALSRTFSIEKSGEAVLGEATPSATLTPHASPTVEATPTVLLSPSPTEILPTSFPTMPKTGSNILPIGFASTILIILGAGMIFLF